MKKTVILSLLISIVMFSCKTSTYYYNKAEKQMSQGEFDYAIENYQQAINKGASKKECSYKIGTAYRKSNRIAEATPFYKAAIDEGTTHETAYLYYGLGLKAEGKYEKAVKVLMDYTKTAHNRKVKRRAAYEYKRINRIKEIPESRYSYTVRPFPQINDEGSDYGVSAYGSKLIFASARGESKTYATTGQGFEDLYTFTFDDQTQRKGGYVQKFDEEIINQDYTHEAEATFTPDGSLMVFARGNDGSRKGEKNVQLYSSKLQPNGTWSAPEKLPINDPTAWNGCPSFSKDGKHLYFASDRSRGKGGLDLYSAEYRDGKFLHVRNMGGDINTIGDEMFPYEKDDTTFMFSSEGQVGYGGLDLFKAIKNKSGKYEISNLGSTINTAYDDFAMVYENRRNGYFSSNRPGGKGSDDIYRFEEEVQAYYILHAKVRDKKSIDSNDVKYIDHAKIVLIANNDTIKQDFTDDQGHFSIKIKKDQPYSLLAQKDHYFSEQKNFEVNDNRLKGLEKTPDGDYIIPEVIDLEKIELQKKQNITTFGLHDIYYDLNKADIREDAAKELDKLVEFMIQNPGISIELGSHTDSRGSDEDNMDLSQRRADSAVTYIINNGIDASRITAKGYGESEIMNKCANDVECSEEEHQMNRRTEIKVTNVENTIAKDREEHLKTQEELEREKRRMEELLKEMEEEGKQQDEETEDTEVPEEGEKSEDQKKIDELKKKLEEMEKKYGTDNESEDEKKEKEENK